MIVLDIGQSDQATSKEVTKSSMLSDILHATGIAGDAAKANSDAAEASSRDSPIAQVQDEVLGTNSVQGTLDANFFGRKMFYNLLGLFNHVS